MYIHEGSLDVKLPTIWTDGKAEVGRAREGQRREEKRRRKKRREEKKEEEKRREEGRREEKRREEKKEEERRKKKEERRKKKEDQGREKARGKKMQVREKVEKSRFTVFPMICGSKGSKSRLAKAAGAEPSGRWETKNCTPLRREAHIEVKRKKHQVRGTFRSWDVEKVHAVVVRSTFRSQNVQNTPCSDHFWKLRCRKSARRCGAKHVSKSKCTKDVSVGPLLKVEMSKKRTPLWREAHFQVKTHTTHQLRSTSGSWDFEKVHAVVARSTFPSQNAKNTRCSDHFWTFRCFAWQAQGIVHLVKSEQNVTVL